MRIRRSRLEIFVNILKSVLAERAITKTRMMYRANVSFRQLQRYIPLLLQLDLIKETKQDDMLMYEITEKGKLFLESYGKTKVFVTLPESKDAE